MGIHVAAVYMAKPGRQAELEAEVAAHVPLLRSIGLAEDSPSVALRASDGTIVEIFEWVDHDAIKAAHTHPVVKDMWERFEACSKYGTLAELPNASDLFAEFELLGRF